jgi:integrase
VTADPSDSGTFWRASDWRNRRKRSYKPVAEAVGIDGARPYDLRHAFASLLIYERRLSVVDTPGSSGTIRRSASTRMRM